MRIYAFTPEFQFTHPGKGATYPAPVGYDIDGSFNSRTLGRVRPGGGVQTAPTYPPVSIHAPWEGCDSFDPGLSFETLTVSIHAPWEGCDEVASTLVLAILVVSIHAPWEGCDDELVCCISSLQ